MSTAISTKWVSICQDKDLLTNTGLCALHDGEQVAIYKISSPTNNPVDKERRICMRFPTMTPLAKPMCSRGEFWEILATT